MIDSEPVHFYKSEEIFDKAAEIFEREKKILQEMIPHADIQHVGSCAIPDAMGKFDVDIQIRVLPQYFHAASAALEQYACAKHAAIWTSDFAVLFKENPDPAVQIDYMLTVIGSRRDDFYRTRDYLINHPEKLREYNELKMKFEGRPYHEYRSAKKDFFGGNGTVKFLEY